VGIQHSPHRRATLSRRPAGDRRRPSHGLWMKHGTGQGSPGTVGAMAFTDVPDDFNDRPLTDPVLVADVLDLVVFERDRQRGAVAVLLCDDEARLRVPVVVSEVPEDVSDAERDRLLTQVVGSADGTGTALVAVARRQGLSIRPGDRAWARAAVRACVTGTRLLGVHVVTTEGSREVPDLPD
jgi:hypothetical protein